MSESVQPSVESRWKSPLLAVHRRLLPDEPSIGWTPYLWLCYLTFFFARWFVEPPEPKILGLGLLTLVVFLVLYFSGYWRAGTRLLWNIAALAGLGMLWTPTEPSAMVFFIYAAGFCGAVGTPRQGTWTLIVLTAISFAYGRLAGTPWIWALITASMQLVIGTTNIYFAELGRKSADLRRSREEVEHLAAMAERERIARDLHDLLGHTLSLITLKAELARKLSSRGDERAVDEIADVERISRDALKQVREAVAGYRDSGLEGELGRARLLCQASAVEVEAELDEVSELNLDPRQEATLVMVLREATTNLARHSGASTCKISLLRDGSQVVLTARDNGRGGSTRQRGNGLTGMSERLAAVGGSLELDGSDGWTLTARIPVDPNPDGKSAGIQISGEEPENASISSSGKTQSSWISDPNTQGAGT